MSVAENIKNVRERMNAACLRAGRDPKEVTLISVSKTKPVSMLMEAYEAGERDYGENNDCRRSRRSARRSRRTQSST